MDAFIKTIKSLKNVIWAIGIAVCIAVLFVGLIIVSVPKYYGDKADILYLDAEESANVSSPASSSPEQGTPAPSGSAGAEIGKLTILPESKDAGQDYIYSLTFLTDSTMIGLREYGLLTGVWGTDSGSMPFNTLSTAAIKYPGDGSEVTIADAAMIAKPSILVICVGSDGLSSVIKDSFILDYEALIDSILAASPNTKIILCSLCSVTNSYTGPDGLNASLMLEANEWIKQICSDKGAYYANVCPELCNSGYLSSAYASSNGKTLSSAGLNLVLDYLKTHALS